MHKIIESEINENEKRVNRLLAINGPITEIDSVLANRPGLQGSVSVGIGYGVHVGIAIHVDSFRELPSFLRALAKQGIHQAADRKPTSHDHGRTYWLTLQSADTTPDGEPRFESCCLDVYIRKTANATCSYVKVGEKTVDVMEWKCEEPADASVEDAGPECVEI